jgi:hypothetical protein
MKNLLFILAACVTVHAQSVFFLPAFKPVAVQWENPNPPGALLSVEIWRGTQRIVTFAPAEIVNVGTSGEDTTQKAVLPSLAILAGTNALVATFFDGTNRSDFSAVSFFVGKLGVPKNLRP